MNTDQRTAELLEAVLGYADQGWPVIPLHSMTASGACTCQDPDCSAKGKHPRIANWPKAATTDKKTIESWWRRWFIANIGVVMGDGLVDIEHEFGFEDNLTALETKIGPLSDTVTWNSGGGGVHRVFRTSVPICSHTRIGQDLLGVADTGVDVKSDGGYAILPPSNHHSGGEYTWGNLTPDAIEVAELPEAWKEYLSRDEGPTGRLSGDSQPGGNIIPKGQRNSALASMAGSMRHMGMSEAEILAALQQVNSDRCEAPLPDREVEKVAASICRYEPNQVAVAVAENHWEQDRSVGLDQDDPTSIPDPGPLPEELLRIPGFVSEVMDHCLDTAPYPNQVMAFCGALSLQAFLAGRKVRDPGDNRTNLYLLGLAYSAAGKDWPRKINTRIAHTVGLSGSLGERFASGEGIQDTLFLNPCTLFQTDEIDGMLQSVNRAKDARHESIMSTLLTMYSSANSVYPMRRKAGREAAGSIDQPCLAIFGTAIPNHYYEALSDRMLTNGFFARMLILESTKRGEGQEPKILDLPRRVLEVAKWWADFSPGTGNLETWHPVPKIVRHTKEAKALLVETRKDADGEYAKAEEASDTVSTTVWGRVSEQVRKLSLIHAISEDHLKPKIGKDAVEWATKVVMHQTRRMLFKADLHVSNSDFDKRCKQVLELLQGWQQTEGEGAWMPYHRITQKRRWSRREHTEVREALEDQKLIKTDKQVTSGRPGLVYQLLHDRRQK